MNNNKLLNKKDIQYYNIKYTTRESLFHSIGLNKRKNSFAIKKNHIYEIKNNKLLYTKQVEISQKFNNFYYKIKTYKHKRNIEGLPCRGQRTRTNAKTKKKKKFKISI